MFSLQKEIKTQSLNPLDNPDQMDHKQYYGPLLHSRAPLLRPQLLTVGHSFTTQYQLSVSFVPGC